MPLTSVEQTNIYHDNPRSPRDTEQNIHDNADSWFFEHFGIQARSSTLICSTDYSQAASYGYAYKIIPVEPFAIIYSPGIVDFYEHYNEVDSMSPDAIRTWLDSKLYREVKTIDDIDSDFFGEVMVSCRRYMAVPMI